jgi:hypothetical protein
VAEPNEGFFQLGEMLAGGGIDREGARLEGLDVGSKIVARRAATTNALAQARLRVDEAENKLKLADAIEKLGGPREVAVLLRAGVNPEQLTGALGDIQTQGFRETVADTGVPFTERQASAQAIEGKVVDPFQTVGPGLFADVFDPSAGPQVTQVGEANIAATGALEDARTQLARLREEKRLHPDRFKASATDTPGGLAETLLGDEGGVSVVPEDIVAEEAFGAEAFAKGGINALADFIGLGTPFVKEAQANEVLGNLKVRTQIVMLKRVSGRQSKFLLQLLGTYAEDPRALFRGDAKAVQRLTNTVVALERDLKRTKDLLNAPTKKTPTRQGELEDALFALADLVADYKNILESLQRTGDIAAEQPDADSDFSTLGVGESVTVRGTTIKRTN